MNHSHNSEYTHSHTSREFAEKHRSLFDPINFSLGPIVFNPLTGRFTFTTRYWGCE